MARNNTRNRYSRIPKAFTHERFLIRRKIFTLSGAVFHIYEPNGRVVFYANQKGLKLYKKDIRIYTGEDIRRDVLIIKARQLIEISTAYDVIDSYANEKVGALQRKNLKSLAKDDWKIFDSDDNEIGFLKEDSTLLAVARSYLKNVILIPKKYYGELNGEKVCLFKQKFNPFVMKMNLDFSMDRQGLFDRRLGIAGAVLLAQ